VHRHGENDIEFGAIRPLLDLIRQQTPQGHRERFLSLPFDAQDGIAHPAVVDT
jgi:hypothetical protein